MEHPFGQWPTHTSTAHHRQTRRPGVRGITLIELMVAVAVLGVLLAIGVPSFAALARQWQQEAAVDTFVGDLRLARSTATRTSRVVVMCAVDGGGACSATTDWSQGWMVFSDLDADGSHDAGEPEIARRGAQAGIGAMVESGNTPSTAKVRFRGNGMPIDGTFNVGVVPQRASAPTRRIILNSIGRARVVKVD